MFRYGEYEIVRSTNLAGEVVLWLLCILLAVVLVLTAMALWKYINKK